MFSRRRCFARLLAASLGSLLVFALSASSAWAAPHVPAFERFYRGADSDAAVGGTLLVGELNCTGCHAPTKALSPRVETKVAPILDEVAQRVKPDYLRKYLTDPAATKPGTTMPNLFHGMPAETSRRQIEALVHFLVSPNPDGPPQSYANIGGRVRGEKLYHTAGCAVCHGSRKADGPKLATDKPLGNLAAKYTLPSLVAFLRDPLHSRPSARMPSLNLSTREAQDIAAFLLPDVPERAGIVYKYYEGSWQKLPDFSKLKPKATGGAEQLTVRYRKRDNQFGMRFEAGLQIDRPGKYTFHLGSDDGSRLRINDKTIVDNDGVHAYQIRSSSVELQKGIHAVQVDMFEQSGEERLTVLFEGPGVKRQALAKALITAQPTVELESLSLKVDPELAEDGRALFASLGCASCHQAKAEGKPVASKRKATAFEKLRPGTGCLAEDVKTGQPEYSLDEEQRSALHSALETLQALPKKPTPAEHVSLTMTRLNCYACHERDEIGGPLEEQDALFVGTQPEMGDEGRLPPPLDGAGDKLTDLWLGGIFAEGNKDRPYMLTRMPRFGKENAGHLTGLLAKIDRPEPAEPIDLNTQEAKVAGWKMVGSGGFSCIKCHTFGRFAATGVQSIDMQIMTRRLREDWFRRYMKNPQKFRKGTRMPAAWPTQGNTSFLRDILDGRSDAQIQAVWTYLSDGSRARTPKGLVSDSSELFPTYEAILYRNFIQGAGARAIGVGYPEGFNLAWDADQLRLALIWKGSFIDAKRHWTGRGQGFEPPAGTNVQTLVSGAPLAVLSESDQKWPGGKPRESGFQFRGYTLTKDCRPTFKYSFAGVAVSDFPNPVERGRSTVFERTLTFTADDPPQNLYFRAAAGSGIEADTDGWYRVGGEIKMRFPGGQPVVRSTAGNNDLLIPVQFDGGKAVIRQEIDW